MGDWALAFEGAKQRIAEEEAQRRR